MWGAGLFGLPTFSPALISGKRLHFMKVTGMEGHHGNI